MALDKIRDEEEDGSGESGGSRGQGGSGIQFHDFITPAANRDDLLTADEKKHLLGVHKDTHEGRVKKQKDLKQQREALKENKITRKQYHENLMGERSHHQYSTHPVLAEKAQFSGVDRQVNALPTENVAETNQEQRDELEHQYRLRHAYENAPKFNPKPQYR